MPISAYDSICIENYFQQNLGAKLSLYFINGMKPCANLQPEDINLNEGSKTIFMLFPSLCATFHMCAHSQGVGVLQSIEWGKNDQNPPKNPMLNLRALY